MIGEAEEQGEWNQCFFGSVRAQDVEEGCQRFWAKKEIDFIDRDENGKIIEIIRTETDRVRPELLYLNFESPKKNT
jgi:hypothetical protein